MQMTEVRGWAEVSLPAVGTLALLLLAYFLSRPRHRLPPGPRGWPLLGSLLQLGSLPQSSLYELSKLYGPLMFLKLGNVKTLVVTSPELAEEVLKTHDQIMSSRPVPIAAIYLLYGGQDIGFSPSGQYWRYLRKVCTVGLLTSNRISQYREIREREALSCLHFIVEELRQGNAVNLSECLSTITHNNITQMIMNRRYSVLKSGSKSNSAGSTAVQEMFASFGEVLGAFNIADFVPLLKPFDPQGLTKQAKELHVKLDNFLDEVIDEHRLRQSTAESTNSNEDFLDEMLAIGQTDQLDQKLSMDSIKAILLDMISGGTDTSSTSALWTLAELVRHPTVMRRVQEELDSVVGFEERLVQEEDLPKLKYLDAVIKEAYRMHPPVSMLLPHESTEDCEIQGFHIPARTRIFVNAWGIHRDPAVWERPLEFDPDRFLNSSVDFTGQHFALLPFGSGRRMCPGMNLGALMVVYMVALLLHALDLTLPDGQTPEQLDMSEQFGVFLYKKDPFMVSGRARLPNHVIHRAQKAPT